MVTIMIYRAVRNNFASSPSTIFWQTFYWFFFGNNLPQDRSVIKTTDAERICSEPEGLQSRIEELVAKYPNGRSFARPSGTEDIVRVYAEAETREVSIYVSYDKVENA